MIVGLSTTGSIPSMVIRRVEHTPYSHAWLQFPAFGRELVYQSDHRGVNLEDLDRFKSKNKILKTFNVSLNFDPIMSELMAQLGSEYDYGGLFGNGVVILGRLFNKNWQNPWQDKDRWYCSEAVAHWLEKAGEKLPCSPASVSPLVLDQILSKSPHATVIT